MDRIVVEAPASSANLGPGFDVFAIALGGPRDRLEARVAPNGKGRIVLKVSGISGIPADPQENSAGAVALSIDEKFGLEGRIDLRLTKGVPVGIGLGSSGASSAAAALAMDRLFGLRMSPTDLITHAGEGERAASGVVHLDNVSASLLGGFVAVRKDASPIHLRPPNSLALVIATPKVRLPRRKTEYARSLVPKKVSTQDMVSNVSMASTMVMGFAEGDIQKIGQGMEDAVVEAARSRMIPGFGSVKKAAKRAGAVGVCISGAGPSMLSFVDREEASPRSVLNAMLKEFGSAGVEADGFVTSAGGGARIVERSP